MRQICSVWKEIGSIVSRRPTVVLPFFVAGIVNAIVLYVLYLAPQRPVALLLGPPIRVFFGAQYLHYPLNFVLLPKLFNYAQIAINGLFGMLMTAVGVGMIADVKNGERASFLINALRALKRYFALFAVWFLTFVLVTGATRLLSLILKPAAGPLGFLALIFYFLIATFVNMVFVYAVLHIIIKKKTLMSALRDGLLIFWRLLVPTALLVVIPVLLYLPIVILKAKVNFMINNVFPEMVLVVLYSGIILATLIEFVIYASLTILYLNKEGR